MSIDAPPAPIDVCDPRFFDDPWSGYRWLRKESPVHWDEQNELWLVSRHEDVVEVSRNPGRYCSGEGIRPVNPAPLSIIAMDDPEHTRQRRLVSKGFTPKRVRELSDHIRELANQCIDEIQAKGRADFVPEFAIHVPIIVIAELLGLPSEMRERLYRWSEDMMGGDGHTDPNHPALLAAGQAFGEYTALVQELIAERRERPKEDLISLLTQAYDSGDLTRDDTGGATDDRVDQLTDDELLMFCTMLVVAGNETTRNAIAGGLLALSRFPEERRRLQEDPDLMDTAVEEIVRWVSPVFSFTRTVTEDHQLRDVDLKAGERVLLLYQSANRDEDVFDDAESFRVDRDPNPHVGFGFGTHFCLGANLARAEIKVVYEELFRRLPDIHVPDDETRTRGDSTLVLAMEHLPAVFTAVHAA
jgi:cytochrome P450 family 142 subfamily A polypeptide 1